MSHGFPCVATYLNFYSERKTKPDVLSAASYFLVQVKNSSALEVVNF